MNFWTTDFFVKMPLFGLVARESRKDVTNGPNGWSTAEDKLCSTYKRFFAQIDEMAFNKRIEYMKHAGDLGRSPMGLGFKIFMFVLVAAEAMGFSYLLGTWVTGEGTAAIYTQLMYGIVFVLASILAILTHGAGDQYYRTSLIRSCFRRYKETNGSSYSSEIIALNDDQSKDKNEQSFTRTLNRVLENPHDMGSFSKLYVAIGFVLVIFVGSFMMRASHLETELTHQTQAREASVSNPFATTGLPDEVTTPQKQADQRANNEATGSTKVEAYAAFVILGVIFLVTQIVGFNAGLKHSFAGKETYKKPDGISGGWLFREMTGAYADTWGFSSYDSYWKSLQPLKDIVNERLKALQHNLKEKSHANYNFTKTFEDYLHEAEQRAVRRPVVAAEQQLPLDKAKANIEAMTDKAQQQAYFAKLDEPTKEALKPWLKARKEAADAKAKQEAELADLF